jgi:hypothetical protein
VPGSCGMWRGEREGCLQVIRSYGVYAASSAFRNDALLRGSHVTILANDSP